jgi:hypothetical protein
MSTRPNIPDLTLDARMLRDEALRRIGEADAISLACLQSTSDGVDMPGAGDDRRTSAARAAAYTEHLMRSAELLIQLAGGIAT